MIEFNIGLIDFNMSHNTKKIQKSISFTSTITHFTKPTFIKNLKNGNERQ